MKEAQEKILLASAVQVGRSEHPAARLTHCDLFRSAFFHKHQILFTRGIEHLEFYNTETRTPHHKLPVKILCRDCHAPIADEGESASKLEHCVF